MASGQIEADLARVTTAKIGAFQVPGYDVPSLLARLEGYRRWFTWGILTQRDANMAARINAAIDDLQTDVSDGALRKQPFCVMLYGFPGTGKSSFAIQIARALMVDLYGGFTSSDMVTLNETDEYQSEYRSSHKVVLFDDIGASKYGLSDTKNPWRKVIDFVNNIKKTALNPNVEMKGKVYIQPDLVILTSNLDFARGGDIALFIPAMEAIFRRFNQIVEVVSHTEVQPLEPSGRPEVQKGSVLTRRVDYQHRKQNGSVVRVSREDYVAQLLIAFREHNRDQEKFLKEFNGYFDDYRHDHLEIPVDTPGPKTLLTDTKQQHGCPDNEAYTPQSGKLPTDSERQRQYEHQVKYYLRHVDWERFFVEHGWLKTTPIHLSRDGIIFFYDTADATCLRLNPKAFEEAYYTMKGMFDDDTLIKAESATTHNGSTESLVVTSTLPDLLKSACRMMKDKWEMIPFLDLDEAMPSPFPIYVKRSKNGILPKQRSYYDVYTAYISMRFGTTLSELMQNPDYISNVPKSYINTIPKINKTMNRIGLLLSTIRDQYPEPFDWEPPVPSVSDDSVNEDTLSEVSDVSDDESTQEDPTKSTSSSMWRTEEDQIRFVLELVKLPPKCKHHSNVQFSHYGEIDLLMEGPNSLLVIELKSSLASLTKARKQALRYSRTMRALRPDKRIIGLTHTPLGFTVVSDLNASLPLDFEGFLKQIGYLDPTTVVEN